MSHDKIWFSESCFEILGFLREKTALNVVISKHACYSWKKNAGVKKLRKPKTMMFCICIFLYLG